MVRRPAHKSQKRSWKISASTSVAARESQMISRTFRGNSGREGGFHLPKHFNFLIWHDHKNKLNTVAFADLPNPPRIAVESESHFIKTLGIFVVKITNNKKFKLKIFSLLLTSCKKAATMAFCVNDAHCSMKMKAKHSPARVERLASENCKFRGWHLRNEGFRQGFCYKYLGEQH